MKSTVWKVSFAVVLAAAILAILFLRSSGCSTEDEIAPATSMPDATAGAVAKIETLQSDEVQASGERAEAEHRVPLSPEEIALRTEGAPLERFHGRIVYESTGQGVPWCGVRLRGVGRQMEWCVTAEDGRFHSRLDYPLAHTLVLVPDQLTNGVDWTQAIQVQREAGAPEWLLEVDLPPTIVVEGELPEGLEPSRLRVSIAERDPGHSTMWSEPVRRIEGPWFARENVESRFDPARERARAASRLEEMQRELAMLEGSASSAQDDRKLERMRRDIATQKDSVAWTIAEDAAAATSESNPFQEVQFVSERPAWRGTAVVHHREGVIAVMPRWEALGEVALAFKGNWSAPPNWQIDIQLLCNSADLETVLASGHLNRLAREPLRLTGLPPGQYTLLARCGMCDEVRIPVDVRGAETTDVEIQLECEPIAGSIRGEITSDSGGEPGSELSVLLCRPGQLFNCEIEPVRDPNSPRWKATFEIKDLPSGAFQLWCLAGEFGIHPSYAVQVSAGDFVRLRVLDRPAYIDLGFRVFDAPSGEELDTFNVGLTFRGAWREMNGVRSGAIVAERVPERGRLGWMVTSPNHQCAEGDLADQASWAASDGNRRWIAVHLQGGWRNTSVVLDSDCTHLQGATILADGVEMGTTDADGRFTLTLPQRPRSIDARYRNWRLAERIMEDLDVMDSCDEAMFIFERKP